MKILLFYSFLILFILKSPALSSPLFSISKSSNRNQVFYEFEAVKKEINTYWLMYETDGHQENLTSYEKNHVYGAEIKNENQFIIKALPTFPITLHNHYGTMKLLGEDRIIRSIHLQLSGGLFPGIKSIEIKCQKSLETSETQVVTLSERYGEWTAAMPL